MIRKTLILKKCASPKEALAGEHLRCNAQPQFILSPRPIRGTVFLYHAFPRSCCFSRIITARIISLHPRRIRGTAFLSLICFVDQSAFRVGSGEVQKTRGQTASAVNAHCSWLRGSKWGRALPGQKVSLPSVPPSPRPGTPRSARRPRTAGRRSCRGSGCPCPGGTRCAAVWRTA